ncbi:MAG: 3-dehydroquinate synthase [Pseudanabaenaceae cyanobacterium]
MEVQQAMWATVHVPLGSDRSYEIVIGQNCLPSLGQKLRDLGLGKTSDRILLVTNPVLRKHYGDQLIQGLEATGWQVATVVLPAGERYKNINSLQKIYDHALAHKLERKSLMIALGGGVIGDITGFAAATWLRGIDFVQVPTTLLAMVDAAIGGKTGINHPQGKNLIGAFHQPRLVWIDAAVLKTLPPREWRAGMAEVIKYGVIWDGQLFQLLTTAPHLASYHRCKPELLREILYRCATAKAEIVTKDEKEAGLRAILNYGHTIGHAIEAVTNYQLFNHGEAVALGMTAVGAIAAQLKWWTTTEYQQQQALLQKAHLPTHLPPHLHIEAIMAATSGDKKVAGGKVKYILPKGIGTVAITDQVPPTLVQQVLQMLQQPEPI